MAAWKRETDEKFQNSLEGERRSCPVWTDGSDWNLAKVSEEVAKDKNSIYVFKIALPGSPLSDCLTAIRDSGLFIFILLNLNVGIILKLAGPLKIYYHL